MPLQTITLKNMVAIQDVFDHCAKRRESSRYINICDRRVYDAYQKCRGYNLRYNRKTNIMRDDRLGILSRPSVPSEWKEASVEEAQYYLCQEVWCNAVSQYNRDTM